MVDTRRSSFAAAAAQLARHELTPAQRDRLLGILHEPYLIHGGFNLPTLVARYAGIEDSRY